MTPENECLQHDIDLKEFFILAEDYIWNNVLPKEGKVKYSWIDFSEKDCPDKLWTTNQTFGPLRR